MRRCCIAPGQLPKGCSGMEIPPSGFYGDKCTTSVQNIPLIPYANIAIYGSTTAKINEKINIDVSGEVGNVVNGYFQKLYIQKLSSGNCDKVEYVITPSGFQKAFCTWSSGNIVIGHETFTSHWEVELKESGNYEVVASAVGLATVPNAQDRLGITVS